ncbi:MAG: (d)CMP kinase [Candidatus Bathyarchaeia archaeon]
MSKTRKIVITIGGLHGVGKSTYATSLAKLFRLRHISAGNTFRKIAKQQGLNLHQLTLKAVKDPSIDKLVDDLTKKEARTGNIVIDAQLAAWMTRNRSDINFLLQAKDKTRYKRIASRDRISLSEARKQTLEREIIEKKRYKHYYNVNIADNSIYDIILNTELLPLKSTINILHQIVNMYITQPKRGILK